MGLLDDAIREHLELKRRRGVDPDEIAWEEHVALARPLQEPAAFGGASAAGCPAPDAAPRDSEGAPEPPVDRDHAELPLAGADGHGRDAAANCQQDTAELDMQRVLDEYDRGPAPRVMARPVFAGTSSDARYQSSQQKDHLDPGPKGGSSQADA